MPPWPDIPNLDWIPEVLRKLLSGQMPSTDEFVAYLDGLGTLESAGMLLGGLIFLIWGYQAFRLLVIANGAVFGALGGAYAAANYIGEQWALFGLIAGGLLLAVLLLPLIRYAVTAGGAWAGAHLGFMAWPVIMYHFGWPHLIGQAWIGIAIGMLIVGLLCFAGFRAIIMCLTAFEGAILAVAGVVALCFRSQAVHDVVRTAVLEQPFLLPTFIAMFSAVGFALQYNAAQRKKKAKSSSSSGSGGNGGGKGKK